jgi:hypothetical protein
MITHIIVGNEAAKPLQEAQGLDESLQGEIVVLKDTLPDEVDVHTMKVISSSHVADKIEIKGRILTIRFLGIYLPAASDYERGSHGEFRFEIQRNPNLVLGTRIQNAASIYFDFNAPVKTNVSEVEVNELTTGIQELISLYPNPGQEYFKILGNGADEVDVFNISGIYLANLKASQEGEFSLKSIPSGFYLLRIKTSKGPKTIKLVVNKF